MKLKADKFYLLEAGDVKEIFETKDEAIAGLKKSKDVENVVIFEADVSGESWQVKQLPWSIIAKGLMGN